MNYQKMFFVSAALIATAPFAFAEKESTLEWNGYFDFYYQNSPQGHNPSTSTGPAVIIGRSFDQHSNQMTLNMAEVSLKRKSGRANLRIDLAAGELVDVMSGGGATASSPNPAANEATRNITQAILNYSATDKLTVSVGKFYTHMGLEGVKAKDNWNYSRGLIFNYGVPTWHQGAKAMYAISSEWTAGLHVVNAWDGRNSVEASRGKSSAGATLSYSGKDLTANYNYIGGTEALDASLREVHEANLTYTFSSNLALSLECVTGSQKKISGLSITDAQWSGYGIYGKYAVKDNYNLALRYEYFDDADGFAVAGGLSSVGAKQKITAWTLSNNFDLGDGLEARIELRSDKSDTDVYFQDKDAGATNHQESYALALLYSF